MLLVLCGTNLGTAPLAHRSSIRSFKRIFFYADNIWWKQLNITGQEKNWDPLGQESLLLFFACPTFNSTCPVGKLGLSVRIIMLTMKPCYERTSARQLSPSFVTQQWLRQELDYLEKAWAFHLFTLSQQAFQLPGNINNAKSNQKYCSPSPNFKKVKVVRNSTKNH